MISKDKIGLLTATFLVIANMVGTGVFTSLGFQVVSIQNTFSILLLWFIGAIIALSGAVSYAELGVNFDENGGEYNFLSKLYNPLIGYLSGFISLLVGFAAPVALASMALAKYCQDIISFNPIWISIGIIILISFIHTQSVNKSSLFQQITTVFKLVILLMFIGIGLYFTQNFNAINFRTPIAEEVISPAFAISLIFVTYAYSGWNSAAYIVNDIEKPQINLPKALVIGTTLVSVLYLLLQFIMLKNASLEQLAGKIEVGQITAINMLGANGGKIISCFIAVILISSISAMVWVGSRVVQRMGQDYAIWKFLSKNNKNSIPVNSIWLQAVISILMILTGSFEQILTYAGIALQLSSSFAVAGIFIIRKRKMSENTKYKSPLYPLPQILFLAVNLWIFSYLVYSQFQSIYIAIAFFAVGIITYYISKFISIKNNQTI